MNQNNMNSAEPWTEALSKGLYESVEGFMSFLQNKTLNIGTNKEELNEVTARLQQLHGWKSVVHVLLRHVQMRKQLSNCPKNYIDTVPFRHLKLPEFMHMTVPAYGKLEILTQQNATIGGSYESEVFESEEKHCIENEDILRMSEKVGYVLDKCLRSVQLENEQREIYTAYRCQLQYSDKLNKFTPTKVEEQKYIVKRVKKQPSAEVNQILRREFKAQFMLTQLEHKNINSLVDYYEDEEWMVSVSHCAGKCDLMDLLVDQVSSNNKGFDEDRTRQLFKGSAEALLIAHNFGLAHRDVSLENIALKQSGDDIELIDWGHCVGSGIKKFETSNDGKAIFAQVPLEGPIGKLRYMAPELYETNVAEYDATKTDVFALGVCLFSFLVGQMPFEEINDKRGQILRSRGAGYLISALKIKDLYLSKEVTELLNGMLAGNPNERMSMKDVLAHKWFTK